MRTWLIIVAILCTLPALARKDDSLDQLIARADSARVEEQPSLYTEIAERQLTSADDLFGTGNVEAAQTAVRDVVTYADKAGHAAIRSGKKLKGTEIAVREMALKLRNIKRTLSFEDQGPVQAAADRLEELRTALLSKMFGKKKQEAK